MNKQRIFLLVGLAVVTLVAALLVQQVAFALADLHTHTFPKDDSRKTQKLIADALTVAKRDHKQVLLEFGADGCSWCRLLEKIFQSDQKIADELHKDYVVIMVDVSNGNNKTVDAKYAAPRNDSVPFTVILDSNGRELLARNIAFADEEALHHGTCRLDADKVLATLKQPSPKAGPSA